MPENKKPILAIYLFFIVLFFILFLILTRKADYDCSDFTTSSEAQKVFNKHEKDVYHLDYDKDGIACESLIK